MRQIFIDVRSLSDFFLFEPDYSLQNPKISNVSSIQIFERKILLHVKQWNNFRTRPSYIIIECDNFFSSIEGLRFRLEPLVPGRNLENLALARYVAITWAIPQNNKIGSTPEIRDFYCEAGEIKSIRSLVGSNNCFLQIWSLEVLKNKIEIRHIAICNLLSRN